MDEEVNGEDLDDRRSFVEDAKQTARYRLPPPPPGMNEQYKLTILYASQRATDSVQGMRLTWSHKRYCRQRAQHSTTNPLEATTTLTRVFRTR